MRRLLMMTASTLAIIPTQGQTLQATTTSPNAAAPAPVDDIVVTARKRAEGIVDVPISIAAVSGAKLDTLAIRDVESAAKLVPNLYVDKVAAGPRVSIRGLGNAQTGGVVDSSVGLAIDGIFFGRPRWLSVGLFDLDSLEVLRGPQSTYYGKNTTAGLINIRTRGPGDQWEGYVLGGHEFEYNGNNAEGAIGGPVTDTLGIRVAYRHTQSDGYLKMLDGSPDEPHDNANIVRTTVSWNPVPGIHASYKFTYFDDNERGDGQEVGACSAAYKAELAAVGSPEDCVLNYRKAPEFGIPGGINPGDFFTRNHGTSHAFNASADLGGLTLSAVTGYNTLKSDWNADGDWGALQTFNIRRPENYKQFSQEVRLQSDVTKPISFVVGAYYDHSNRHFGGLVDVADAVSFDRELKVHADSYAAFGEVTVKPFDKLSLIAGGRYTDVRQRGYISQDGGLLGHLDENYPGSDYTNSGRLNSHNFSPTATAEYQFNPTAQVYASFKKGFKAGGFDIDNSSANGSFSYGDEKAKSFEIGAKLETLGRKLLLTADVFQTDVKNLQVQSYTGTGPVAIILNAASARLKGAEGDARYRFSKLFSVNVNAGYTHARYRDFPFAPCTLGQDTSGFCPGVVPTQNLAGKRLPLAPSFSFSLGADYAYPVTENYNIAFNATLTHRTAVYLGIEDDPLERSPSLTLIDTRVAFEPSATQGFTAAIVVHNLLDKKYVTGAIALPASDSWAYQVGMPRTVELQIGYRF